MNVVLVGAGRYGQFYADRLLSAKEDGVRFAGVVEQNFTASPARRKLEEAGVPVFRSMEEFYAREGADLAVLCTPPFLHAAQSVYALSHGSCVLCEKPAAPTASDVERMIAAEARYGRFIAIGYQWSYSQAMQAVKRDLLGGLFGKPVLLKTMISWPRDLAYYGNAWSGRLERDGVLILDSVASNACAHFLHNMFFLLGERMDESAAPVSAQVECLRANAIESYDTCALRMRMREGAMLYFIATHAAKDDFAPGFVYEFENAVLTFSASDGKGIVATFRDGTEKRYGIPTEDLKKLDDCISAVRTGTRPVCTAKTALPHAALIESIYRKAPICDFPREMIVHAEGRVYVDGLSEKLREAYARTALLSECGYSFVTKTDL